MIWERFWPFILGAAVGLGFAIAGAPLPPDSAYASMMAASAGVSAILVGFLSAAKAILLTISGSKALRALRQSGYADDLFKYIKSSIEWAIAFSVLCIIMMYVDAQHAYNITVWKVQISHPFMIVWAACGAVTIFTFYRVSRIIFKILRQS
ncbi:MAG: hypothetical protein Q7Q73_01840 [Verrucomicrobiota bacterium JB024]|nr:hypothetical protein [Verrucomicrobiota bacterium JB024]